MKSVARFSFTQLACFAKLGRCTTRYSTFLPMSGVKALLPASLSSSSSFHSSTICWLSKKDSKKGGKGKSDDDESAPAMKLPDIKSFDKSMDGTLNWAVNEFAKMKVGRISVDLFANLAVESFGTVGKAGQVTLKSNAKLVVAVFDPSMAKPVSDAIRGCGLNINPTIEGSNVMATIPRPSKESRDAMVKAAQALAEKAKNDIRNKRKGCMDDIKKCKGSASEDDIKRHTKEIEALTEKKLEKISQLIKAKENEINSASD